MDKITCIVKRSTWARGDINGAARLLNTDGNMCCLGFLGKDCGVSDDSMVGLYYPQSLFSESYEKYPVLPSSITWKQFAHINDRADISESDRESQLQALAEQAGFTFVFVD